MSESRKSVEIHVLETLLASANLYYQTGEPEDGAYPWRAPVLVNQVVRRLSRAIPHPPPFRVSRIQYVRNEKTGHEHWGWRY